MKRVVLLGTSHDIQRGRRVPDAFSALLQRTFEETKFASIAEEIDAESKYVAERFCNDNGLAYVCIEPTREDRIRLGIPSASQIVLQIMDEFSDEYPEISVWPSDPNEANLPAEVWGRYRELDAAQYRARESVWLEKMFDMESWPCLCIIGANHFNHYLRLLIQSGFDVVELSADWEPANGFIP